jgi:hypothetical protein
VLRVVHLDRVNCFPGPIFFGKMVVLPWRYAER